MSIELPAPIASYIDAENGGETAALARCFVANAVVKDEGRTIVGLVAIQQWMAETRAKYQHHLQPRHCVETDAGAVIVTNRLSGSFPGSPIDLEFVFRLDRDKITQLDIR